MEQHSANILIVDDEDGMRGLFKDGLEDDGYLCVTAPNGNEALHVLATKHVDLALVDVIMPGMTGLSLFQHMQEHYPDVAVIFVTAMDDLNMAVGNLKNGAYDYIVKPVTRKRMRQAVGDALTRRQANLEQKRHNSHLEERLRMQRQELEVKLQELKSLNQLLQSKISDGLQAQEAVYLENAAIRENQIRSRIVGLQELIKKRISEYLYGQVQSKLLSLQHRLDRVQQLGPNDHQKATALLQEIRVELRTIQEQGLRRASLKLYPPTLNQGLVSSLRGLVDIVSDTLDVKLSIEPEVEGWEEYDWRAFPEEHKVVLYRIAEEALDNVVQHAKTNSAQVTLGILDPGHIHLEIADVGCGFEPQTADSALGLLAMKEYAKSAGGTCQVESTPGKGTRVHVVLALPVESETR